MPLFYRTLADAIVVIHLAYVLIVVLGLPAIWIGIVLRKNWARNVWFRCGHLAMILIVVFEAWANIVCPLTVWEAQLRQAGGQIAEQGSFVQRLVHSILFYRAPPWVFTLIYSLFGLLVVLSFIVAPPRWTPSAKPDKPSS